MSGKDEAEPVEGAEAKLVEGGDAKPVAIAVAVEDSDAKPEPSRERYGSSMAWPRGSLLQR